MLYLMRAKNRARTEKKAKLSLPKVNWQYLGSAALIGSSIAATIFLIGFFFNRPVRHIQVTGNFHRVSVYEVEQVVSKEISGGFLTANLAICSVR